MFRRSSLFVVALSLGACAQTYFESYEAAHPGWKPDFPKAGIDAQETLASIYAPHEIERGSITEVRKLRAFEVAAGVPRLELDAFARGAPGQSVLVAHVSCSAPKGPYLGWFYNDAISWFVLQDGRLSAWRYAEFQEFCHAVSETRGVDPPSDETRAAILQALESVIDRATAATLLDDPAALPEEAPSVAEAAAETACPGRTAFAEALRDALRREPSVHTYFVTHDLVLTIAIENDGSLELVKIRPTDFFARQLVQQVRRVSGSPDRPTPPGCMLGTELELEFAR